MDEETRQPATEPFVSTEGVGKGASLGLSMVHGLAFQLGGPLEIESSPRLGADVDLWSPERAKGEDAAARDVETPIAGSSGVAPLVDDEDLVRLSAADMLRDLGYDVLEASTAPEGLAIVRNGVDLDLIVTDHLRRGVTGRATGVPVRQVSRRPPIGRRDDRGLPRPTPAGLSTRPPAPRSRGSIVFDHKVCNRPSFRARRQAAKPMDLDRAI